MQRRRGGKEKRNEAKAAPTTTRRRTTPTSTMNCEEEGTGIVCSPCNIPPLDPRKLPQFEMGCCCSSPEPFPGASDPYMLHHPTINNFHFYTDNPECIERIEKIIDKVQNPSVTVNPPDSSPLFFDTPVAANS